MAAFFVFRLFCAGHGSLSLPESMRWFGNLVNMVTVVPVTRSIRWLNYWKQKEGKRNAGNLKNILSFFYLQQQGFFA